MASQAVSQTLDRSGFLGEYFLRRAAGRRELRRNGWSRRTWLCSQGTGNRRADSAAPVDMRILLIGLSRGITDEGMCNVTENIFHSLENRHEVLCVPPRSVVGRAARRRIRAFSPDLVHYVHGPTLRSLVLTCYLSKRYRCRSVISATRPFFTDASERLIPFLRPDVVLSQSWHGEQVFRKHGVTAEFLPNGVDVERFRPVASPSRKQELRRKHGIDPEKFVILHVGGIRRNRNIRPLSRFQSLPDAQVVVVGSITTTSDNDVQEQLLKDGCAVIHSFQQSIEEWYQLADCYVFPLEDNRGASFGSHYNAIGCIDTPLSVLEAMSCNLPVISTPFGALPRLFQDVEGLNFCAAEEQPEQIARLIGRAVDAKTRASVLPYSWAKITEKLESVYRKLFEQTA